MTSRAPQPDPGYRRASVETSSGNAHNSPVDHSIRHVTTVDQYGVEATGLVPAVAHTATDRHLDETTRQLLTESVPENTREAYSRARGHFESWCHSAGRTALPAHPATLTSYVANLIACRTSPATISQHVGAIRTLHAVAGFKGQPDNTDALQLLRGWRRACVDDGVSAKQATPLLRDDLRVVIAKLNRDTVAGRRDHVLLVLGFALMARRSELAALSLSDVEPTSEGVVISIRRSKTDQDARGKRVAVPHGAVPDLDLPALMQAWRGELAQRGITDGPVLRVVDRNGNVRDRLRPSSVNTIVRRAVKAAKLPNADSYSAHSLRAGGLTSSLERGALLSVAAAHGRWSLKSPVVLEYARSVDQWQNNAMRGVL